MKKQYKVFITGASSGFGEACAFKFAEEGCDLILTGRRLDKLKRVKTEIQDSFAVEVLVLNFDVRNQSETEESISKMPESWKEIDILINNAGLASGLDTIQNGLIEDWDKMIDTNVKGLLYVSNEIIPLLIKKGKGHIINIGSTAGKEVYKNGGVYCASKHAVDAISKSMRIDLLEHGIKVTQICPGAAETEFSVVRFKGDQERAKKAYEGYQPMNAKDIADVVYYTTTLPDHLCINDLVMTSLAQANSHYINRKFD